MRKEALLSEDGVYRWWLGREWSIRKRDRCVFIMLNPSTADARVDDPTIRRCIGFAKSLGCGGLSVVNLYALRSTDPGLLLTHKDPVGDSNDFWINITVGSCSGPVIAAWGSRGGDRASIISNRFKGRLTCFGLTLGGQPRHPLYLPTTSKLIGYA